VPSLRLHAGVRRSWVARRRAAQMCRKIAVLIKHPIFSIVSPTSPKFGIYLLSSPRARSEDFFVHRNRRTGTIPRSENYQDSRPPSPLPPRVAGQYEAQSEIMPIAPHCCCLAMLLLGDVVAWRSRRSAKTPRANRSPRAAAELHVGCGLPGEMRNRIKPSAHSGARPKQRFAIADR
jgi:hypothetical protein